MQSAHVKKSVSLERPQTTPPWSLHAGTCLMMASVLPPFPALPLERAAHSSVLPPPSSSLSLSSSPPPSPPSASCREREAHRGASRYQHPPTAHTPRPPETSTLAYSGMTVCVGVFVTSDRRHMNTTTNGRATQSVNAPPLPPTVAPRAPAVVVLCCLRHISVEHSAGRGKETRV